MKHQVIAIALGSALALPAFANNEIDAGSLPKPVATTKTVDQVREELSAAKRTGDVMVNGELGYASKPDHADGKTRSEVRADVVQARRSGNYIINAELGMKANQL
jgi:hypothetical protein